MENLLNPVDPVVHGQVVHRRSRRSHFFCDAILHLSSFVFNWEKKKKKKKGKERIVEISSTTDLSYFFFLQLLKTDIQSVLFQFLFFPLLIYSFLLRRHFIRFAINTKYLFQL